MITFTYQLCLRTNSRQAQGPALQKALDELRETLTYAPNHDVISVSIGDEAGDSILRATIRRWRHTLTGSDWTYRLLAHDATRDVGPHAYLREFPRLRDDADAVVESCRQMIDAPIDEPDSPPITWRKTMHMRTGSTVDPREPIQYTVDGLPGRRQALIQRDPHTRQWHLLISAGADGYYQDSGRFLLAGAALVFLEYDLLPQM